MKMYGLFLCLCLCDSFNVFACGVSGILCDAVWCVVLFYVIVVCLCLFRGLNMFRLWLVV